MLLRDWEAEDFAVGYYSDSSLPAGQTRNLKTKLFTVDSNDHDEARRCRQGITSCFETIGVYAMSGPGNRTPNKPQYGQSQSWDPEFRNCVIDFVSSTLSEHRLEQSTKRILDTEVTGLQLTQYVSLWVRLISEAEGMVESRTLFETTANIFYSTKIDTCLREYKEIMTAYLNDHPAGVHEAVYKIYHAEQEATVKSRFCTGRCYGGLAMRDRYLLQLHEKILEASQDFFDANKSNVKAKEERLKKEEFKKAAIDNAKMLVELSNQDLELAKHRRQGIVNNKSKYSKTIYIKEKNTVAWGAITVSPSYRSESVHDPEAYNAALQYADLEIKLYEERVATAESNLAKAENM